MTIHTNFHFILDMKEQEDEGENLTPVHHDDSSAVMHQHQEVQSSYSDDSSRMDPDFFFVENNECKSVSDEESTAGGTALASSSMARQRGGLLLCRRGGGCPPGTARSSLLFLSNKDRTEELLEELLEEALKLIDTDLDTEGDSDDCNGTDSVGLARRKRGRQRGSNIRGCPRRRGRRSLPCLLLGVDSFHLARSRLSGKYMKDDNENDEDASDFGEDSDYESDYSVPLNDNLNDQDYCLPLSPPSQSTASNPTSFIQTTQDKEKTQSM